MEPGEVLNADANTGWKQHDALVVADAIKELPREHDILLYFEQPCLSYEACLAEGYMTADEAPGLGVTPIMESLTPVADFS